MTACSYDRRFHKYYLEIQQLRLFSQSRALSMSDYVFCHRLAHVALTNLIIDFHQDAT